MILDPCQWNFTYGGSLKNLPLELRRHHKHSPGYGKKLEEIAKLTKTAKLNNGIWYLEGALTPGLQENEPQIYGYH